MSCDVAKQLVLGQVLLVWDGKDRGFFNVFMYVAVLAIFLYFRTGTALSSLLLLTVHWQIPFHTRSHTTLCASDLFPGIHKFVFHQVQCAVQLTGNVARRYSRVPGPNAEIPCTRPASKCVDNCQPREYF